MNLRLAAAALLTLAMGAMPAAQSSDGPPELDSLMALLAQRRHGEADFREQKYLSMLTQPLES